MHIGMFMEFGFHESGLDGEAFREGFELVDAAEAWGLDSAWLSEFHFSPQRSVLSSPIVTASAMAARTKRMRIGMAVYVLPLTNPLRVAEEAATLDHICQGRLDFGIGVGWMSDEFAALGMSFERRGARSDDYIRMMQTIWQSHESSYEGEFVKIKPGKAAS